MMNNFLRATSLGIEVAVSVFIGAGVGYLIDTRFSSKPWGLVVGLVIGAIAGFWTVYKYSISER